MSRMNTLILIIPPTMLLEADVPEADVPETMETLDSFNSNDTNQWK